MSETPFRPVSSSTPPISPPPRRFPLPLYKPTISYILLALIIIIWIVMTIAGGTTNDAVLIRYGAKYGPLVMQGELWRLFSSMFIHIGLAHLAFNGFALYSLGTESERLFGSVRYILVYLLSGLFGSLLSLAMRGWGEYSAGASGAIFGVIGMNLAYFLFHRNRLGEFGRQRAQQIFRLIAINLIIGFAVVSINNYAHIGGLVAGFVLGYLVAPNYRVSLVGGVPTMETVPGWGRTAVVTVVAAVVLGFGVLGVLSYWTGGLPFSPEVETAGNPVVGTWFSDLTVTDTGMFVADEDIAELYVFTSDGAYIVRYGMDDGGGVENGMYEFVADDSILLTPSAGGATPRTYDVARPEAGVLVLRESESNEPVVLYLSGSDTS